jgi:hypothetical protein
MRGSLRVTSQNLPTDLSKRSHAFARTWLPVPVIAHLKSEGTPDFRRKRPLLSSAPAHKTLRVTRTDQPARTFDTRQDDPEQGNRRPGFAPKVRSVAASAAYWPQSQVARVHHLWHPDRPRLGVGMRLIAYFSSDGDLRKGYGLEMKAGKPVP